MASPSPNPKDGDDVEASESEESSSAEKRLQALVSQLPATANIPTRLQYVPVQFGDPNIPGPSGIKQIFRTVKTCRRIPTLPKKGPPKEINPQISITVSPKPSTSKSPPKEIEKSTKSKKRPKRDKPQAKNHICRVCEKRFSSPGKLNQHLLSHTGELPFSCDQCDKKFNSKFKLVRHSLIHNESRAFACPLCERTFNRKDHLNNHIRVHNPMKKVYVCEREDCGKQYTSLLSFKKHAALHSAEEGNLTCKICNRQFDNREEIVFHLKVHSGSRTVKSETDKKFTCSFCGRKFFTGKDVRRHLVVHTGRRDFVCQFCPQKFGRKDHLVRHVKNAHASETWQSTVPGPSTEIEVKPTVIESDDIIQYIDFPLAPGELEALLEGQRSEQSSSDSAVKVKVEVDPGLVKLESSETQSFEDVHPVPGTSQEVFPPSVFIVPSEFPTQHSSPTELEYLPSQELGRVLNPQDFPIEDPNSILMELLESSLQQSQSTVLPTFTQAFQSAQSPKPPPPPPPTSK